MSKKEKIFYLMEKYSVSYWYAMDILKSNDWDLMLSSGYFRDMQNEDLNNGRIFCFKCYPCY